MEIILYTTHCPQCKGVEMMLKKNNIEYREVTDVEEMKNVGLAHTPALSVDGKILVGREIFSWINGAK